MSKKILFLVSRKHMDNLSKRINYDWVRDENCLKKFNVFFWGPGYTDNLSLENLKIAVDKNKPDYIYCYNKSKILEWLPDLSSIKVHKIMVELDTYKHDPNDSWYKQFDKLYCRQNAWTFKHSIKLTYDFFVTLVQRSNDVKNKGLSNNSVIESAKRDFKKYEKEILNIKDWSNIELFRWSVKKTDICQDFRQRKNINFFGRKTDRLYLIRRNMSVSLNDKINFSIEWDHVLYNDILRSSSALLCPTECSYGDFVPAKIFEFAASGAAILTNCDLIGYNMKDLDEVVIKYTSLDDLKDKLDMDFSKYYNKASEVMRNHTHDIRYSEIFI